jgi:ATP-dependent DNA helicase DinG
MTDLKPADILGEEGRIAARLPHYELRPQQLQMADAVADAIERKQHLIVEAGTGVGKSFAYLVPAILAATSGEGQEGKSGKRVIISTHTISLQEQLISKDLPFLNSVIPREFSAVLVKGRGNYLSKRRLDRAAAHAGTLFNEENAIDQLQTIRQWSRESPDGSRSDLGFRPLGGVWDEVASDSNNCLGRNCGTYKECFYYRARRRVQHAQILVVNHALFFSDLALRREGASILPDYDAVVFDEAHTMEGVAGGHLGFSVSSGQVEYVLNKLYNDRTNKGLLVHHKLAQEQQDVMTCRNRATDFFSDVQFWLQERPNSNGRVRESHIVANELSDSLANLGVRVRKFGERLDNESDRKDLTAASDRLIALADDVDQWCEQSTEGNVYWTESSQTRRGHARVALSAAPIDVGQAMQEHLFSVVPSVIMTSATLAVGKPASFDYFRSRVGITQTRTLQLGSPFDYRKQVKLVLASGMPDPRETQAYEKATLTMVKRLVARSDGHAFVLFTSYQMLRNIAAAMRGWLAEKNLALYSQADGVPRHQLLERFKANSRAVLFGTDSFWQGVDVPGDALTNVIITKLPFSVPDQPLLEARLEAIREKGGNPFNEFQLPEAVIKLRQGFGRLIRTARDTGMVAVLDPRVKTKRYGKLFVESLPDCEVVEEPLR